MARLLWLLEYQEGIDYPDGVIINGGNITLTATNERNPSIYAGFSQHKNIIINGGNITLNSDFGIYTAEGVISLNNVDSFNANVRFDVFKIGEKEENDIKIKNADYSKVDEAISKAKSLNQEDYKDFSEVESAINAVIREKTILEQSEVDAMAMAIINAINALELKNVPVAPNNDKPNVNDSKIIVDNVNQDEVLEEQETINENLIDIPNPNTSDVILVYDLSFILSVAGLGVLSILFKKIFHTTIY